MNSVILLSGGKGERMMDLTPKQYLLLAGKPIIMHTLERIDNIEQVNQIILICADEYIYNIKNMQKQYNLKIPITFVRPGLTRQESVYNGLMEVINESVIIHEAVRPFVSEEEFRVLIDESYENVTYGYTIPYTVLKGVEFIEEELNRSELVNIQLPQKFNTNKLLCAHKKAIEEKKIFTEDASLIFHYLGEKIKILYGTSYNIKITEPIDLDISEIIYKDYIVRRK